MKFLLVVALAVAVCAKPKPDIGLIYKNTGSYGSPSRTYIPSAPSVQYQTPVYTQQSSNVYQQGQQVHYNNPSFSGQTVHYQTPVYTQGGHTVNFDNFNSGSSGSYQTSNFQTIQHTVPTQVQVTRRAYFFDSPDSGSVGQTRIHIAPAPIKKNINYIFVKSPNYGHNTRILAQQQQQAEKTHVYVLVKNQEDNQDITIPSAAPVAPVKPEVFFVKYKTQKEAEDKIQATLQGAHGAAHHAQELGSEGALLTSIEKDSHAHHTVGIDNSAVVNQQQLDAISSSGSFGNTNIVNNEIPLSGNVISTQTVSNVPVINSGSSSSVIHEVPTYNAGTVTHTETHSSENHPGYNYKK